MADAPEPALADAALRCVDRLREHLIRHRSVVAIVLLGSLLPRRGFDRQSDLDVGVFLDDSQGDVLALPFSFTVSVDGHRMEVNLTQLRLRAAAEAVWEIAQLEAFANGRVLFDPLGAARRLIERKVAEFSWRDELVGRLNQVYWRGLVHSSRAVTRGGGVSARFLLAEAMDKLVESIFLINRSFPPHTKWWTRSLAELAIVPDGLDAKLRTVFDGSGSEPEEIARVRAVVADLYDWSLARAREADRRFPADVYEDWANRLSRRQPVEQTFVHLAVAQACSDASPAVQAEVRSWLAFHAIAGEADLRQRGAAFLKADDPFVSPSEEAARRIRVLVERSLAD